MTDNIENSKINAAVDMLIESDQDLSNILGKEGLIKQLSRCILERALAPSDASSFKKHLTTENGELELVVPRDRKGKFEPAIVKKKQTGPVLRIEVFGALELIFVSFTSTEKYNVDTFVVFDKIKGCNN